MDNSQLSPEDQAALLAQSNTASMAQQPNDMYAPGAGGTNYQQALGPAPTSSGTTTSWAPVAPPPPAQPSTPTLSNADFPSGAAQVVAKPSTPVQTAFNPADSQGGEYSQQSASNQSNSGQPSANEQPAAGPQDFKSQLEAYFNTQQQSLQNEKDINTKIATAAQAQEALKTDAYKNQVVEMGKNQAALETAHTDATKKVESAQLERQKALDAYKDMINDPKKLDEAFRPKGIFEGASTGQTILGAIAIALGGAGGGPNQALGIIQKQLDKEQDARINTFKNKLAGQQNIANEAGTTANMARQQEADNISAINNRKIMQLETIGAKVNQYASQYNSATLQLRAQDFNEGINRKISDLQMENNKQKYSVEMMKNLSGLTLEGYDKLSPAQKSFIPEPQQKLYEEQRERTIPGYGVSSSSKEAVAEFRKGLPELEQVVNGGNRILNVMEKGSKFNPDDRAKVQTMMGMLLGPMREQMGFKTLTEPDQELLKGIMGDPNAILALPSVQKTKLKTIIAETQKTLTSRAQSAGFNAKTPEQLDAQYGAIKAKF